MAKLAFAPKARWMGKFTRSANASARCEDMNCVQVSRPVRRR